MPAHLQVAFIKNTHGGAYGHLKPRTNVLLRIPETASSIWTTGTRTPLMEQLLQNRFFAKEVNNYLLSLLCAGALEARKAPAQAIQAPGMEIRRRVRNIGDSYLLGEERNVAIYPKPPPIVQPIARETFRWKKFSKQ